MGDRVETGDEIPIAELEARLGVAAPAGFGARRVGVGVASGAISGLHWADASDASPRVVLIHGGGQNAHTWDAVAVALGLPAVALELPGHGHSDWRDDQDYSPWTNAPAIASAVEQLAPDADLVVGMSLGGLTAIRMRGVRPDLVRRLALVDVTPSSGQRFQSLAHEERGTVALLDEDRTFASFDDMLAAVTRTAPPGRDPRGAAPRGPL